MLVIKIELHSAVTGKVKPLGQAIIINDGTGEPGRGNYEVRVGHGRDAKSLAKVYTRPARKGRVENYPRLSYSVWRLVIRALRAAFPEEK